MKPASALSRIARFALTLHLQCGKVVPRPPSRRLFSRDSAGRGGVAEELTVAVGSLVVVGTPIADSEYFVRLGERFRQTVEGAFHGLSFHHGTETERELKLGWQEDQLLQLTQAREQGYRLLGKDVQQSVRERVQGWPERLREYPLDERKEQALRVQLAASLRDDAAPDRRFFHLRDGSTSKRGFMRASTFCLEVRSWRRNNGLSSYRQDLLPRHPTDQGLVTSSCPRIMLLSLCKDLGTATGAARSYAILDALLPRNYPFYYNHR